MSDEALRKTIAEICGWTEINTGNWSGRQPNGLAWFTVPDYPKSLDACVQFERFFGARDWKYVEQLKKFSDGELSYDYTPRQRCEAFLAATI